MGRPRVPAVTHVCEECGRLFAAFARDHRRFCSKSCSGRANSPRLTAEENPRFNGGLSTCDGRTIIVHRDGKHWTFFYRAVMEAHLGRPLDAGEIVHHINGNPSDDRIENLQVLTRAQHIGVHRQDLLGAQRTAA